MRPTTHPLSADSNAGSVVHSSPLSRLVFKAGGTLKEGHFYLARPADDLLPEALLRGDLCYVLAPRQMGKSSLRHRVASGLSALDVRCASIDLTSLGTSTTTPSEWYFGLQDEICRQLGVPSLRTHAEAHWQQHERQPPVKRFGLFLSDVLLAEIAGPIVLFFDEIDAVRALPFPSDDFFATLRATYNRRADEPALERLRICLLGVAQPADLIDNELVTPFNIGTRIDLSDFSRRALTPLTVGLSGISQVPGRVLDAIYAWTNGHPYMVQRLCEALASQPGMLVPGEEVASVERMVARLFLGHSSVRDSNLAFAERTLERRSGDGRIPRMLALHARLLRGDVVLSDGRDAISGALQLTGIAAVRVIDGEARLVLRNRIFATYFDEIWLHKRVRDRLLGEPTAHWLKCGRSDEAVLRDAALVAAENWAQGRDDLTSEEQQLLRASWRMRVQTEADRAEVERARAEAARRQHAESAAHSEALERRQATAFLIVLAVLGCLGFLWMLLG